MTITADRTASALVPSRAASPPTRRQWQTSGDAGATVYVADGGARSLAAAAMLPDILTPMIRSSTCGRHVKR